MALVNPLSAQGRLVGPIIHNTYSSDPASPSEGTEWYRSDLGEKRIRAGGETVIVSPNSIMPRMASGRWYPIPEGSGALTTVLLNVNVMYLLPFIPPKKLTLAGIGFEVSTAGAGAGQCRVGIYKGDGTDGDPGTLVGEYATQTSAAAFKNVSNATPTLAPILYYVAIVSQFATTQITVRSRQVRSSLIGDPAASPNLNLNRNCYYVDSITGALPATCPAITGAGTGPYAVIKD